MGTKLTPDAFPISVKSFDGGLGRGACLAIEEGELTRDQVVELIETMHTWLANRDTSDPEV